MSISGDDGGCSADSGGSSDVEAIAAIAVSASKATAAATESSTGMAAAAATAGITGSTLDAMNGDNHASNERSPSSLNESAFAPQPYSTAAAPPPPLPTLSSSTMTAAANTIMYTLPRGGPVIDCKNTLQSYSILNEKLHGDGNDNNLDSNGRLSQLHSDLNDGTTSLGLDDLRLEVVVDDVDMDNVPLAMGAAETLYQGQYDNRSSGYSDDTSGMGRIVSGFYKQMVRDVSHRFVQTAGGRRMPLRHGDNVEGDENLNRSGGNGGNVEYRGRYVGDSSVVSALTYSSSLDEVPVAVPLSTPTSSSRPGQLATAPGIHYLMIEPTATTWFEQPQQQQQDRLVHETESVSQNTSTSATLRRSKRQWSTCRFGGWMLALALSVLIMSTYWKGDRRRSTPNNGSLSPPPNRNLLIIDFINNITLSGRTLVPNNQSSPSSATSVEEIALHWMLFDDELLSNIVPDTTLHRERLQQRYAMVTLWAPWITRYGLRLVTQQHECDWTGTTCSDDNDNDKSSEKASNSNLQSDDDDAATTLRIVTHIELPSSDWKGRIVSDLALLSSLVHFDVSNNALTGSLPLAIAVHWTALQHLDVSMNQLTGSLPTAMGQYWKQLQYWNMSYNGFGGSIPQISTPLTRLEICDWTQVGLSGSLPTTMGQWNGLVDFRAGWNSLTGRLAPFLGNWTRLEYFDMTDNQLTGTIPSTLARWSNLTHFSVGFMGFMESNALTGSIPDFVSSWTRLDYFNVAGNDMTGSLPRAMSAWTNLTYFNVAGNSMTGTLPPSLGRWTAVQEFHVGMTALFETNAFNGTLPESMAQWSNLQIFNVAGKNFTGSLPDFIGPAWTKLTSFNVAGNEWSGSLPSTIGQWTDLTEFQVGSYSLLAANASAAIPALNGSLPTSIGQWTMLQTFDITGADLTGPLPTDSGHWTHLQRFIATGSGLTGSLPESIVNWTSLTFVKILEKRLVGTIPTDLCAAAVNLTFLWMDCDKINCTCGKQKCNCN